MRDELALSAHDGQAPGRTRRPQIPVERLGLIQIALKAGVLCAIDRQV